MGKNVKRATLSVAVVVGLHSKHRLAWGHIDPLLVSWLLQLIGVRALGVARPPGLEPGTYSLEGCCTIQLCYGRKCCERECFETSGFYLKGRSRRARCNNKMAYSAANSCSTTRAKKLPP